MIRLSLLAILLQLLSPGAFAQKKDDINYSQAFQLDSTEFFIIPRVVDNDDQQDYGKGKGYFMWGNYRDVIFYNSKTNQSKKVFGDQLALIQPFFKTRNAYYYGSDDDKLDKSDNILPEHIIYLARTENYNKDNALDSDDPLYLYISSRNGENLKQITPQAMHVLSWTVSKDNKMILLRIMSDKNGNKKFGNGDDESYYRIDLDVDISKIKCYQISL